MADSFGEGEARRVSSAERRGGGGGRERERRGCGGRVEVRRERAEARSVGVGSRSMSGGVSRWKRGGGGEGTYRGGSRRRGDFAALWVSVRCGGL